MIALTKFQKCAIRKLKQLRMAVLLWRRQGGKTTLLSWIILRHLAEAPGSFITFVSASLSVGTEIPHRTTQLFNELLDILRNVSGDKGPRIESNGEGLDEDKLVDMFKQGKLEIHFRHSKTVVSRMKVIAPNIATARGYSGWVIMDEIGFIPNFKEILEAVEPIISRDPTFVLIMATTYPNDDAHFCYELTDPEPGTTFDHCAEGNWYVSQMGVHVHRVDAWDAELAGVPLYEMNSGAKLTPEQHRAQAFDKDAWDRNYGLIKVLGGTSAIGILQMNDAQDRGAKLECLAAEKELPDGWADKMSDAPWAIGYDPATTENKKSNPSSIVVTQETGPREYAERFVFRFKTADDRKAKDFIRAIIETGTEKAGRPPKGLAIDGTSEKYFARQVKSEFSRHCPVHVLVSSNTIVYQGDMLTMKAFLGQEYVNAYDGNSIAIPPNKWVKEDRRLVKKAKGSFDNNVDASGNHGDTFDGGKNAFYVLRRKGGPSNAKAVPVGMNFGSAVIS